MCPHACVPTHKCICLIHFHMHVSFPVPIPAHMPTTWTFTNRYKYNTAIFIWIPVLQICWSSILNHLLLPKLFLFKATQAGWAPLMLVTKFFLQKLSLLPPSYLELHLNLHPGYTRLFLGSFKSRWMTFNVICQVSSFCFLRKNVPLSLEIVMSLNITFRPWTRF